MGLGVDLDQIGGKRSNRKTPSHSPHNEPGLPAQVAPVARRFATARYQAMHLGRSCRPPSHDERLMVPLCSGSHWQQACRWWVLSVCGQIAPPVEWFQGEVPFALISSMVCRRSAKHEAGTPRWAGQGANLIDERVNQFHHIKVPSLCLHFAFSLPSLLNRPETGMVAGFSRFAFTVALILPISSLETWCNG